MSEILKNGILHKTFVVDFIFFFTQEFFEVGIRASNRLHNDMFWRIMRSPMAFFDARSVGVVLTR